jgi:aminoglycoside 6'-N-acetyltransferase
MAMVQPQNGEGLIRFRPLTRAHFVVLSEWMTKPHVFKWWQEGSEPDQVEALYGPAIDGEDATEVFIVERETKPIGLVQRYRLEDNVEWQTSLRATGAPEESFGIDYFIGVEDLIGRGVGTEMIRLFVDNSWNRYPECSACVVGVSQGNRRSWRALEGAGFTRVWSGLLESDDPSDDGPQYVYLIDQHARTNREGSGHPKG